MPIIQVDNVSMRFNLAQEKTETLKEYTVKLLKHQLFFNEFYALQDVSFSIEPGPKKTTFAEVKFEAFRRHGKAWADANSLYTIERAHYVETGSYLSDEDEAGLIESEALKNDAGDDLRIDEAGPVQPALVAADPVTSTADVLAKLTGLKVDAPQTNLVFVTVPEDALAIR